METRRELPRLSLGLRTHYRKLTALGVYRERWPRIKVMTWNDEVLVDIFGDKRKIKIKNKNIRKYQP